MSEKSYQAELELKQAIIEDLQARLSANEEFSKIKGEGIEASHRIIKGLHGELDDLQARLSAAEAEVKRLSTESWAEVDAQLKRAEEVVEAAKDHQNHPDARLMRTIRRYEEGKK